MLVFFHGYELTVGLAFGLGGLVVLSVLALDMFDKMAQKRIPDDSSNKRNSEGNHSPDDKRRKSLPSFQSVVQELMSQGCFQRVLEPMLRRVDAQHKHCCSSQEQISLILVEEQQMDMGTRLGMDTPM